MIPSAIIVIVLAVLQYWWSTRLSETTAVRLADSLQMSMTNWQMDLFRYLLEIGLAMRTDPSDGTPAGPDHYVRRLAEWRAVARYPDLVSSVYLLKLDDAAHPPALRLNPSAGHFEPAAWTPRMEALRPNLQAATADLLRNPFDEKGGKSGFPVPRPGNLGLRFEAALFGIRDPSAGWRFEPEIPLLLHPVISGSESKSGPRASQVDWIAIELNPDVIGRKVLADLAETYFRGTDGLDYQVAVISRGRSGRVIYSSDQGFGSDGVGDADGVLDVFGRSEDTKAHNSAVHVFHAPSDNKGLTPLQLAFFPLLRDTPQSQDWRLVVRHRRGGSLGGFVGNLRRRDFVISSCVLLLVAINMAMLIATSHRARRLAQLQMNFVTAVSHELRTPLTVIISGADNICNGVVESKQQMQQYGSVIGNQARQLFGLVERILLFAAMRQTRPSYNLRPVDVSDAIEAVLTGSAGLIEAGHFVVDRDIEPDLPPVMGDAAALSQCLQNLVTNALKYGKDQRWLGIRAYRGENGAEGREILIDVSDRGIGIGTDDLPHIFEPFYRSPAVRAAQIHGTGLGLPLSQSIAEAMKGKLTVTSSPGRGSTFTLQLPCASA